jgi:predicted Fe-Mo cluster-binding NifX family protein
MGGVGLPPELMKKAGAYILICKDLGPKALILCKQLGIDVYVCEAKMVKEAFKMWANREIKKADMTNVCDEHKE